MVRDQEVGGSNPLAPTNSLNSLRTISGRNAHPCAHPVRKLPVNVGSISGTLNIGNDGNHPNATGISPVPTNRTSSNFWNIAAFDTRNPNLAYQFGNVGRNVLLTPGVVQWDISALKNIRIRENH